MRTTAPITLFVYNRPIHTSKTIKALKNNFLAESTELIIFSDGYKNNDDKENVTQVRRIIRGIQAFRRVTIVERDKNYGLANNIIWGVTDVVQKYGKVIVLEDDLVTSPFFLKFMNDALDFYINNNDVISVHGYIYPVRTKLPETFFIRGADCWGWATWKRGWDLFELDGAKLLAEITRKKLQNEFDLNGSYPYTKMLADQTIGLNNSWAIRWYASAFLKNKLTLYPGISLVNNIGTDDSGTHCRSTDNYKTKVSTCPINVGTIAIKEDSKALKAIEKYLKNEESFLLRVHNKLTILKQLFYLLVVEIML